MKSRLLVFLVLMCLMNA